MSVYKETCQTRESEKKGLCTAVNNPTCGARCACRPRVYSARVGGQVEAREPSGVTGVFGPGQSGGGQEGARPARAGPVLAPPRSARGRGGLRARGAGASRFLASHGAADVTSRRRGGCGRVPGVPEVRQQLRGARAPGAAPSPLRQKRGQGPGARPPGPWSPFPGCGGRLTVVSSFVFL